MVFLNSLYILLFLFALGLPLSLLCSRPNLGYSNLLLAPHFGLVCLTIPIANAYLLNVPVSKTVLPMACVALLASAYGVWRLWHLRREHSSAIRDRRWVLLLTSLLAFLVIGFYGLPFILYPRLEYYAYAGTDGSAYITTAEYLMTHGVRDAPQPDFYHPFSQLIAFFTIPQNVQKSGTFSDLAFFSVLIHRLPHQVFSCLMLLASILLFSSCYVFARSLHYGPVSAGFAAFLGALCPSLLALTSNTYLGASLTLPLLPVILFLAEDAAEKKSFAVLLALTYSAYWLISEQSWLIPVAFAGPYLLYSVWKRARVDRKGLLINLALFCAALIAASAVPSRFIRSFNVVGWAFTPRGVMSADMRAWNWTFFWHAIGVGDIMASPALTLGALGRLALLCTIFAGILYIFLSLVRRRFSILFFAYCALWLVVLIGGVLGRFQNFVLLGRVSEQAAFLHPLVYIGLLTETTACFSAPSHARTRWTKSILAGIAFATVLFVSVYPIRPIINFERDSLGTNRQRTNQFEQSSLKDRIQIEGAAEALPALLSPSAPDPTSVLHIAALFSNVQLLVPPEYLKFFLLQTRKLPGEYYCAKSVLIPELYADIVDLSKASTVFQGAVYHLVRNDLIPIPDDETFPIRNGLDVYFLKEHSLTPERTLRGATAIHVCSSMPRTIRIEVRYEPPSYKQDIAISASPSNTTSTLTLGSQGVSSTGRLKLSKGQNSIEVTRAVGMEPVAIRSISVVKDP